MPDCRRNVLIGGVFGALALGTGSVGLAAPLNPVSALTATTAEAPDCVTNLPKHVMGYGAPLGAMLIKTLPQTIRITDRSRIQIGYSAFILSATVTNWNPRYQTPNIRGALDRLAGMTARGANPVETGLVVPLLETVDVVYQTFPEATAHQIGALLNTALAMVNPASASALCVGLGLPTHVVLPNKPPWVSNAKDPYAAFYPYFNRIPDFNKLVFNADASNLHLGFLSAADRDVIAKGHFTFGDILVGRGSAFQARMGNDYAAVMGGQKTASEVVPDAVASRAAKNLTLAEAKRQCAQCYIAPIAPALFGATVGALPALYGGPAAATATFISVAITQFMYSAALCPGTPECRALAKLSPPPVPSTTSSQPVGPSRVPVPRPNGDLSGSNPGTTGAGIASVPGGAGASPAPAPGPDTPEAAPSDEDDDPAGSSGPDPLEVIHRRLK